MKQTASKIFSSAVAFVVVAAQLALAPLPAGAMQQATPVAAATAAKQVVLVDGAGPSLVPLYLEGAPCQTSGGSAAARSIQLAGGGVATQAVVGSADQQLLSFGNFGCGEQASILLDSSSQHIIAAALPPAASVALNVQTLPAAQPAYELARGSAGSPPLAANVEPPAVRFPAPKILQVRSAVLPSQKLAQPSQPVLQQVETYNLIC
jgi:hypothetical protein